MEERITARHKDMDWSIEEEVKSMSAGMKGQGLIPPVLDLSSCPAVVEALRATDVFCDKYLVLRRKVEILQEQNNMLRKILKDFSLRLREHHHHQRSNSS